MTFIIGGTAVRKSLAEVIEPIAGEVEITHWQALTDVHGKVTAYKAWVVRR